MLLIVLLEKNDDYCPYIIFIEDENKTIVKPESFDLDYYKNSSYYFFPVIMKMIYVPMLIIFIVQKQQNMDSIHHYLELYKVI